MAFIQSEKLLLELVEAGKLSFNEEDLKGEKNQSRRKLLYRLGAYKHTPIGQEYISGFGLKKCKKLIDLGKKVNVINYIGQYLEACDDNYTNVLMERPSVIMQDKIDNGSNCYIKSYLKDIASWKDIKRGKDLFIKGLGSFDITNTFNSLVAELRPYSVRVFSVREIRCRGYFPTEQKWYLESLYDHSIELFKWVYINKFPIARLDELKDLDVLGMFKSSLSLNAVLTRIDNMVKRDLRLTWRDKDKFVYPDNIKKFANMANLTIPKNGIDLKKQAHIFKNCSGSYVNRILEKKTFIVYNDYEMVELSSKGKIKQHFGKLNSSVDSSITNRYETMLRSIV